MAPSLTWDMESRIFLELADSGIRRKNDGNPLLSELELEVDREKLLQ